MTAVAGRLEVRRSRRYASLQLTALAALFALGIWSLLQNPAATRNVDTLLTGGFFAAIMAYYLWRQALQARDRQPLVVIDAGGLTLPTSRPEPIPWRSLREVRCRASALGGGRLDIVVDPEVFQTMRFGMRALGETIVSRPAEANAFSILTRAYDHSATEIFSAMRAYKPAHATGWDAP